MPPGSRTARRPGHSGGRRGGAGGRGCRGCGVVGTFSCPISMVRAVSRRITIYRDMASVNSGVVIAFGGLARGDATAGAGPASGLGGHGQASPVRERSDVAGGRHGGIALVVRRLVAVVGAPGTAKEAHAAAVGRQAVEDPLEVVLAHDDEVGADVDGDRAVRVDPDGQVVGFRVASTHGLSLPRSPR